MTDCQFFSWPKLLFIHRNNSKLKVFDTPNRAIVGRKKPRSPRIAGCQDQIKGTGLPWLYQAVIRFFVLEVLWAIIQLKINFHTRTEASMLTMRSWWWIELLAWTYRIVPKARYEMWHLSQGESLNCPKLRAFVPQTRIWKGKSFNPIAEASNYAGWLETIALGNRKRER